MIKAIIFDFFGVLTTEGFRVFCGKYFTNQPEKRDAAQKLMETHTLGKLEYNSFIQELSKMAVVDDDVTRDYLSNNKPNEPLLEYIHTNIKPHYKVSVLSNAGADWIKDLLPKKDVEMFDDIVVSYHFGLNKPMPKIYELAAERLGAGLDECVMIDDIERFCEGARHAGMQAIVYKGFEQMKADLEQKLGG